MFRKLFISDIISFMNGVNEKNRTMIVITSYSIHYTKLYDAIFFMMSLPMAFMMPVIRNKERDYVSDGDREWEYRHHRFEWSI